MQKQLTDQQLKEHLLNMYGPSDYYITCVQQLNERHYRTMDNILQTNVTDLFRKEALEKMALYEQTIKVCKMILRDILEMSLTKLANLN